MTEQPTDRDRLEPTIVPVQRPAGGSQLGEQARRKRSYRWPGVAAGIVAVLGIVTVFFYLPDWVDRPEPELAPVFEVTPEPTVEAPALSEEQRAALQAQAEDLLAELLEQQQELAARSAASWGDVTWTSYESAARLADEAFLADDLVEAVSQYQTALATGQALLDRSESIMADALAAGEEAIAVGNAELAESQFELVLGVDPNNARAAAGLERARKLPDVLQAMRAADELAGAGELELAAAGYRDVLSLDPEWSDARRALDDVNGRIEQARFDEFVSSGFAALDAGRNSEAREAFAAALAMRPASDVARDGMDQAEQGELLDAIAMAEIRAKAFESRELWDQAIARYREALATDPTLRFAIDGLARSQYRADLDVKLQVLIDSPRLLLTEDVLADARELLGEAAAIEAPGPKLGAQLEQLSDLIELASTPVTLTLVSDGETEVTVYRVGELGSFMSTDVTLRPGSYTAVGHRIGYRDVRINFTALPGSANEPVTIVCTEPI